MEADSHHVYQNDQTVQGEIINEGEEAPDASQSQGGVEVAQSYEEVATPGNQEEQVVAQPEEFPNETANAENTWVHDFLFSFNEVSVSPST